MKRSANCFGVMPQASVRKCGGAKVGLLHRFIVDMFGIEA